MTGWPGPHRAPPEQPLSLSGRRPCPPAAPLCHPGLGLPATAQRYPAAKGCPPARHRTDRWPLPAAPLHHKKPPDPTSPMPTSPPTQRHSGPAPGVQPTLGPWVGRSGTGPSHSQGLPRCCTRAFRFQAPHSSGEGAHKQTCCRRKVPWASAITGMHDEADNRAHRCFIELLCQCIKQSTK